MRYKVTIFIAFVLLSCRHDVVEVPPVPEPEYFIFGHFHGECGGERCNEYFRLDSAGLSEDVNDHYANFAGCFTEMHFVQRPDSLYQLVKDLPESFPERLYNEPEFYLGLPDAGDWGGLYVEHNLSGVSQCWLIDKNTHNVHPYYHGFIALLKEKILLVSD